MQKQYDWLDTFNLDETIAVGMEEALLLHKTFNHSPAFTRSELINKINDITTLSNGFCFAVITEEETNTPELCDWYNLIVEKIYNLTHGVNDDRE